MMKVYSSLHYTENIFWYTKKKPPFKSYNTKQYTGGTFSKIQINVLLETHVISHNKVTGILLAHTI
jgi:hypothetical protein